MPFPGVRRAAVWSASCLFVFLFLTYLLLRPPLFNFDGYTYRLGVLKPTQATYINPHHLLWYPVQKVLEQVTSRLGPPSPEAFQVFGIAVSCLSLALYCLLMMRLTDRLLLPLAISIFIAFSPPVWKHGLQNQPYPLVYLFLVLFFWTVSEGATPSRLRLALGSLALAAAVFFQQAMSLTVPAVAVGLVLATKEPLKRRLVLYTVWAGGTALLVAAVYVALAGLAGIGLGDFFGWTLGYLGTQHGLQVHWLQSAAKSAIGMVRALLPTNGLEDYLRDRYQNVAIYWLYGILLLAGCSCTVAVFVRKSVRDRFLSLVRSRALFAAAFMTTLAWSAFVFLWEPAGPYWSLDLFPVGLMLLLWLNGSRPRTVRTVTGLLLAASIFNLYANHQQDRADSANYPPPLIRQIEKQLGPHDIFIVAGRDWYSGVDYDLLLECLNSNPPNPGKALLDEFVMPERRRHSQWQSKLAQEIRAVWQAGGRVFVAGHVLSAESYVDLQQIASPFSEYARAEFAGVDGEKLGREIKAFFEQYELVESRLRVATDRFWEVRRF